MRLTNVDISNFMIKQGIKTEDELLSLAWARAKDGEPDLQSIVLNKTSKARADLIATTWRITTLYHSVYHAPVVGTVKQDQNTNYI